ncbi:MAG: maleylacetoacetate isomerase [Bdellovibrionaceae bacterium]|nr:maleylacetoacetate isomerase [Pseudobdellovibrionaceae bacterium]MBX3034530.1 maleylacetoacetate isomerase [Pseudobdellovibrionaceae bacterium]
MTTFVLYNYFRSSTSYRVRIALHLKNLPFEYKAVNLLKSEQTSEEYRRINPLGEVPALLHEGHLIAQSLPIMEYLDEMFPEPRLYPWDPVARAQVRQFCENINAGMHPLCNLKIQKYLEAKHGYDQAAKEAWIAHWTRPGFAALEQLLQRHAGTYCFGDQITAADVCLVPMVFSARRFNVDLGDFPIVERIDRRCQEHPAFQQAHPLTQVDTPEELRRK